MPEVLRFSQLTPSQQAFVRLCQTINYGSIESVQIRDGDPVFSPPPVILLDIKLDKDEEARPEVALADFVLRDEILRLMERLALVKNGTIARIEVRAGIPRRAVFMFSPTEVFSPQVWMPFSH